METTNSDAKKETSGNLEQENQNETEVIRNFFRVQTYSDLWGITAFKQKV